MRTIEEILSEAKSKDLILANLFELRLLSMHGPDGSRGTGQFQANFHHKSGWHDYGKGSSPTEALEDALKRAKGLSGPDNRPIPKEIKMEKKAEVDVDDLI